MKAFILAAGSGERLRPLTERTPKCLVAIRSEPLLSIWLGLCRRHGIDEALVNTHSHAGAINDYLKGHIEAPKVRVTVEEVLLGSAGTLMANRDWIQREKEFWILYADVLTNLDLTSMLEFHRRHNQIATMGVYQVSNPSQCGIATIDEEHIVRNFVEKPSNPPGNLAFSGIIVATPAILDVIPERLIPADIGFHVLPKLIGRMAAFPITEYLLDIGTLPSYQKAQVTWRELVLSRNRSPQPC